MREGGLQRKSLSYFVIITITIIIIIIIIINLKSCRWDFYRQNGVGKPPTRLPSGWE